MKITLLLPAILMLCNQLKGQNPYLVTSSSTETAKAPTDVRSDFAKQFPYYPMAEWKAGMRFMFVPKGSALGAKLHPYGVKDIKITSDLSEKDLAWKLFTVSGIEERSIKGKSAKIPIAYVVFENEGKKYEYQFLGSMAELKENNALANVDGLIYLDEIDKAKELLVGRDLYTLKANWQKSIDADPTKEMYHQGLQFVKVKVTKVGLGSSAMAPVRIVFQPEGEQEEAHINVSLSGTNSILASAFPFDNAFAFDDPRAKYPGISDEVWEMIQNGKVRVGMTKQECELSWGKPKDVNKTISGSSVSEQWVYSKEYLYFTDGVLSSIQN